MDSKTLEALVRRCYASDWLGLEAWENTFFFFLVALFTHSSFLMLNAFIIACTSFQLVASKMQLGSFGEITFADFWCAVFAVCCRPRSRIPFSKKKKRRRRMLFNGQSLQEALSMLGRLAVTCLELCDDWSVSLRGWRNAWLFSVRVQDLPHLFIAPRTIAGERTHTHTLYCTQVPRGGPHVSTGPICKSAWPGSLKSVQQCDKTLPSCCCSCCCCYTCHLLHPHSISKVSPCHTEKIKTIIFTLF